VNRALAAMAVALLVGFAWQRARSPFLAIASRVTIADRVAHEAGVASDAVLAAWYLLGASTSEADLHHAVRRWRTLRQGLGDGPAVLDLVGLGDEVVAARAAVGADREALWERLGTPARALWLVKFQALQARFGDYLAGHR